MSEIIKEVIIDDGIEGVDSLDGGKFADGKIQVTSYLDDEELFSIDVDNTTTIYGNLFFAEKAMNRRVNFDRNTIEKVLRVFTDTYELLDSTLGEERIIGFIAGVGGEEAPNMIVPGKRQTKIIPGLIPFRVVDPAKDLTGEERDKYFLRVEENGKVKYYGKKPESVESSIKFDDGTEVPENIHTNTGSVENIHVFNRFVFKVGTKDFREHFMALHGSTALCKINTIGLVTGIPVTGAGGKEEFRNVRCMTAANVTSHSLSNPASTVDFKYNFTYR